MVSDFDSPWKEALEHFFPAFLEFFFPRVHEVVDWSRGYEALDKELQQIVKEAAVGRRYADKLFRVWLLDGAEAWVLVHVEVQSQRDEEFPERMFVYNYRLYDRHRRPVVSLAILGDEQADWRPSRYGYSIGGSTMGIEFPIAKLLDYGADWQALGCNPNPFAPLVFAHLKTMETRQDAAARKTWKITVIKGLYERGFSADQVRQLFRAIDWMMELPAELDDELQRELSEFEQEKHMPYVTSIERIALKRGEAQGKAEALLQILRLRFSEVPEPLDAIIKNTKDLALFEKLISFAMKADSLDEFRRLAQL